MARRCATRLGLHPRSATDFFDALVALGMLERDDGRYANTPATDLFLDRAKPSYVGGILEMANARLYGFWGSLTEALRTGQPAERGQGRRGLLRGALRRPGAAGAVRARDERRQRRGGDRRSPRSFPGTITTAVIDIGCAEGAVPVQIALAHEHITGGGFDLPALEPIFDDYVARFGLGERLSFTAGDFFADPLPTGRRARDGAHPARLGPRREAAAAAEGLRRAARRRRADRLRGDHRRRAARATHSAC